MSVLIVGAGPTGLLLALALARNGVACRVVDRQPAGATGSRALGCQPRSMEVLSLLGVIDPVLRISEPLAGSSVMRGTRELARIRWVPPDAPFPYTYVFPQSGLERILRERLAELGVLVEWNAELSRLEQPEGGVVATLADGRRLEADWLVGCDGAHSRTREAVGLAFEGRATGEAHWLADVSLEPQDPVPIPAMWLGPDGPLMLMRLPGEPSHWRIFADVTGRARTNELTEPAPETLQALLDERGMGPGQIRIRAVHWTSTYRTNLRLAAHYRARRVFLAGDAAHVFPPYGGQGMNTGLQDAFNLGWKLAYVIRGRSPARLLGTYEAERRPVAAETIRDVDRRRRIFALRNPLARALRDLALRVLFGTERASRAGSYATSELGITYRGRSWPSVDDGAPADPRAGDRAPDGPLAGGRLFDALDPTRFTLLCFGGAAGAFLPPADLPPDVRATSVDPAGDPDLRLTRIYRAETGAFVLVRPDGYIGFRGGGGSRGALHAYLDDLLCAGAREA